MFLVALSQLLPSPCNKRYLPGYLDGYGENEGASFLSITAKILRESIGNVLFLAGAVETNCELYYNCTNTMCWEWCDSTNPHIGVSYCLMKLQYSTVVHGYKFQESCWLLLNLFHCQTGIPTSSRSFHLLLSHPRDGDSRHYVPQPATCWTPLCTQACKRGSCVPYQSVQESDGAQCNSARELKALFFLVPFICVMLTSC